MRADIEIPYAPLASPFLLVSQRRNWTPLLYSSPPPFAQDLTHRAACASEKARLRSFSSSPPGVQTEEGAGFPCAEISRAWQRRTVLVTFRCLDVWARTRSRCSHLGMEALAHEEAKGRYLDERRQPHPMTKLEAAWRQICDTFHGESQGLLGSRRATCGVSARPTGDRRSQILGAHRPVPRMFYAETAYTQQRHEHSVVQGTPA
jgi:hypothetical protein